jgi:hypothetical protein
MKDFTSPVNRVAKSADLNQLRLTTGWDNLPNETLDEYRRLRYSHPTEDYIKHLEPEEHHAKVKCFFNDLDKELLYLIEQHDSVVGCVAWLTHPEILEELALKKLVSIIVQKEDFLRPDGDNWSKSKLLSLYANLKSNLGDLSERSKCGSGSDPIVYSPLGGWINHDPDRPELDRSVSSEPIRILGDLNTRKLSAFPRMHHKFLVFCKQEHRVCARSKRCSGFNQYRVFAGTEKDILESEYVVASGIELVPYAVWTGSFNITKNAANSIENAVLITDSNAVQSYFDEWRRIFLLSRSIKDWDKSAWEPSEHVIY